MEKHREIRKRKPWKKRQGRNKRKEKDRKKEKENFQFYKKYVKRPMDFICALVGIIFLSPVMLVVAVLVKVKLGSPVIFTQERPGLHEKIFKLYKFRSMSNARDKDGNLLPDEKRLGKFGKVLRATSLDELPELINILKGDMSIVGPRPLLVEYLTRYNKRQHKRHMVRPGLTGYAQVHGRNMTTWEERLERDVWYVEHITFLGDIRIIFKTIRTVLSRNGVSSETCVTMEEFRGDRIH